MAQDLKRSLLEPCMREVFGLLSGEALGVHAILSAGAVCPEISVVFTDGH
jgi:hypothetical protein